MVYTKMNILRLILSRNCTFTRNIASFKVDAVSYVQGQSPKPKIREYFYYVDHQGMLFLDDSKMKNFTSCFKDKQFLEFFFKRVRKNNTGRYPEFPYVSLCGRERNFIRCDDLPIVFTSLIEKPEYRFCYNHAGDLLSHPFEPDKIYMDVTNGRVYHPAPEKYGGIGLVASKLAIKFSKDFEFENGDTNPPTKFSFNKISYILDNSWYK